MPIEALNDPIKLRLGLPTTACPRVCVLFGKTRGDNAQLLILAKALGWPFEIMGEVDSVPMTVIDRLAHLPTPRTALLVGGDSGSCRFIADTGRWLAAEANDKAWRNGGSLLISTSGRTPKRPRTPCSKI